MVEEEVYLRYLLGFSIVIILGSSHFSAIIFYFIQSNCCRERYISQNKDK
jgi:membrane-bound acyltransferase YfiQ involved in biofilm formation